MKKLNLFIALFVLLFAINGRSQMFNWNSQTNPISGMDLNSAWAVSSSICWMCGATTSLTLGYVIKTTNTTTWTNATGNIPSSIGLYSICGISASEAWVGASGGSVYHTTNGGTNWSIVVMPSPQTQFIDVIHFFNQNTGFIIGDPYGGFWCYYWTTNAGVNWTFGPSPAATGTEAGWGNSYCVIDTGHIWFGTNNSKIYRGGFRSGFVANPTTSPSSMGIAFINANSGVAIMGSAANNITTNGGINWYSGYTPIGPQYGIKCILGTSYYWTCGMGTTGGFILFSSNYGVNWTTQFTMPTAGYCITTALPLRGWVGCASGNIYKNGDPDEVNNINTKITEKFLLKQNHPNPFNPATTIEFNLPKETKVTLKVYDLLGNEVSTLINNEEIKSGNNSYLFDASYLSSGIYYYKLFTNDFVETKKMLLIK